MQHKIQSNRTKCHKNHQIEAFNLPSAKSLETFLSEPAIKLQTSLFETLVARKESEDNVEPTDDLVRDSSLHAKVDKLLSEIKVLREQSSTKIKDPAFPSPFPAIDTKCPKDVAELMLKWPDAKNLINLTSICSHSRFFSGDVENGVLSVLRCETCYNFLFSKRTATLTANPVTVAKKGLGG